ncbi:MAG: hypothetical protein OXK82_10655 [Deltaproteobacteria bacterium]|nr:hypothetical protein [Deltaproteobacteria bacterium]
MAGIIALAICVPATTGNAHIPNECANHAYEAQERVDLYTDGLRELRRISEDQDSDRLHQMRRAILLSIDAIEASTAVVMCAKGKGKTEATAIQESCLVRMRLADRTREATEAAQLEIKIAGLSPLEQRFRRLVHEQNVAIERERRYRENVEKCRAAGIRSETGQ